MRACHAHNIGTATLRLTPLVPAAGQTEAVRTRQHVNPLKAELQVPLTPPDWAAVFADPARPLAVDVGCGSGRFALALARRFPGCNLLGLDIRGPARCPVTVRRLIMLM